jgi:hypothetical protein
MYRLLKDAGNYSNIIVENTDTKATVMIGKINMEILNILDKAGITMGEEMKTISKWDTIITTALASELVATTVKMKKPIRKTTPSPKEETNNKQVNKNIDAMDVLLGLANYV